MAYQPIVLPASGTTFAQFQAGGLAGMILRLLGVINAAAPTLDPTAAPTLAASGSGGTLPAASYYVCFAESNSFGSTKVSPLSAVQAITLGQDLVITPPALQTGNISRSYYVGTSPTVPGTLAGDGSTASTFTISAPLPSNSFAVAPNAVNKTALTTQKIANIRAPINGNLQPIYNNMARVIDNFNSGNPMAFDITLTKLQDAALAFAVLSQCCSEAGVLIDANPGTFSTSPSILNAPTPIRVWP
jgi:hypothetical protein